MSDWCGRLILWERHFLECRRTTNTRPNGQDEANRDEYSSRDQPVQPSFHDSYGFDERDGPPEEDEQSRYVDDPDESLDEHDC